MRVDQLRITGFSGMDTESMVKKIMAAQKTPLYKLQQQKQVAEWKRTEYREVNSLLLELRNAADNIRMQSSFQKKAGTSSNESIVKVVSATNSAMNGVHKIEVTQLASAASLASGQITVQDYTVGAGASESFFINGTKIELEADKTYSIKDIANAINAKRSETGVQVNYDESNGRLFFMNSKTGSASEITITGINNDLKTALNLTTLSVQGSQAKINYNGTDMEFNSNNVSVNGLSLDLRSAQVGTTVDVTVGRDTNSAFESIVKFIDKYNEVIGKINDKLGEEKKKGILPLTDEDREKLSEKQIELWEKNAKSGLIRHDSMISSALGQFRLDFSSDVKLEGGEKLSMFSFGFETGDYTQQGKIIFDPDKLKEALTSDPDKIMNLFTNYSSNTNAAQKHQESGLAERIYQSVNKAIKSITDRAGTATSKANDDLLSEEIRILDRRISDFEDKLYKIENRYWKQFTAMEKAIQNANAQSGWLMSQFGGGM